MSETRIYRALLGVRGQPPVDLATLEAVLVRLSQLIVEQPWIAECDINPLIASPDRVLALDARIVLHDPELSLERLPRPAIRPYPIQYVRSWKLNNGTAVVIRMIRPEDEAAMVRFHRLLSERTVWMRYFHALQYEQRVTHDRLVRVCFGDYDRELCLVAELEAPNEHGQRDIVAVGRLSRIPHTNDGEFAILIGDQWQNQGLGSKLLGMIVEVGRAEGLSRICADILPENLEMQKVAKKTGFSLDRRLEEQRVVAEIALDV